MLSPRDYHTMILALSAVCAALPADLRVSTLARAIGVLMVDRRCRRARELLQDVSDAVDRAMRERPVHLQTQAQGDPACGAALDDEVLVTAARGEVTCSVCAPAVGLEVEDWRWPMAEGVGS